MGTDEAVPDSDRRWAEAGALLENPQDEAILQGARRRRRRMLFLFSAVAATAIAVAAVAGFLIAAGDDNADGDSSSGPLWLHIVGVGCSVVGLLIIVTYVIRARRAGLFRLGPLSVLNRSQQRSLRRQMLGKEPLQPVRLPLLRYLAGQTAHHQNVTLLLPTGLMLGQLGNFLASPELWRAVLMVTLALLFLGAGLQIQRQGRRAERFLAEHPQPPEAMIEHEWGRLPETAGEVADRSAPPGPAPER